MSLVIVDLVDTFDEWRIKTNSIGSNTGDLTTLTTVDKTSIVAAVNEIFTNDSDDLENIVEDLSPQLGGDLDLNGKNITDSIGTSDITISGTFTAGFILGAINISTDLSPQLGGDLDLFSQDIIGTGNINITGSLTATSIAGTVLGVTQSASDNSTKLATTAYVDAQVATENTLDEMDDTTISSPTDGQILVYNTATTKWLNETSAAATTGFAVAIAVALG